MKKVQAIRKLALMLEPNGTVKVVSSTKLYVGGFGFVGLAVYVPITQHRADGTNPFLTVHASDIDPFGKFGSKGKYSLPYIGEAEIDGTQYLLFERPMPKAFLEKAGELKLIVNYSEIDASNNVKARLTSEAVTLQVEAGGKAEGETASETEVTLAALNEVTAKIEQLTADVDKLLEAPDCTNADNVATQDNPLSVKISETGKLKFSNIKGEKGDAATIKVGAVTTLSPDQNAIVSNSGTDNDAVLNFGIPQGVKGDKGDAATIAVGKVESISYEKSAIVENSGSVNDAVLDFKLPQGKPAEITIGKTTTLSPESSARVDNVGTHNAPILDFAIPQGKAAEVSVGSTKTLPPESSARVENVGTKNEPVLDFYIPKGDGFRISKTYASIEAMHAAFQTDGVPLHGFAIIETGNVDDEDNAKLFCKGEERYEYLTDLSGAQGFKGDTGVGRVVIGSTQQPLKLLGNGERPKYSNATGGDFADNGEELAFKSDLSSLPLRPVEIDATGLDVNTWYPITFQLRGAEKAHIRVYKSLGQDEGVIRVAWSTHGNKSIAYNAEWVVYANGWGANPVDRTVLAYDWLWCEKPFGQIEQMVEGSVEYIYVRGGAKYYCYVNDTVSDVLLRDKSYTVHNQTIAPVTTCNANLEKGYSYLDNLKVRGYLNAGTMITTPRIAVDGPIKAQSYDNQYSVAMLKSERPGSTTWGDTVWLGANGRTIVTGGESKIPVFDDENLFLESNASVYIYTNTDDSIDNAKIWTFGSSGNTTTPGGIFINGGDMTTAAGIPLIDGQAIEGVGIAKNGIGLRQQPGRQCDAAWIRTIGTTESDTVFEIATGDDGNEAIVARQYNTSGGITRELILLDTNGDTRAPGRLSIGGEFDCSRVNATCMELVNSAPYIDFHFGNTANDYSVRLVNSSATQLDCVGSFNATGTLSEKGNRVYSKLNTPYGNVLTYTTGAACCTALSNGIITKGMYIHYNFFHFLIGSPQKPGDIQDYTRVDESGSGLVIGITSSLITYINYSGSIKSISIPNKSGSSLSNTSTYFSGSINFYY